MRNKHSFFFIDDQFFFSDLSGTNYAVSIDHHISTKYYGLDGEILVSHQHQKLWSWWRDLGVTSAPNTMVLVERSWCHISTKYYGLGGEILVSHQHQILWSWWRDLGVTSAPNTMVLVERSWCHISTKYYGLGGEIN